MFGTVATIVIGFLAVVGVLMIALTVFTRFLVSGSRHYQDAARLSKIVELVAERGTQGAFVAIRAVDDLMTLAGRHPTERMVQRELLSAADRVMTTIPAEVPPELLEAIIAYAEKVIDARPARGEAAQLARMLRTLGASRAHTAVARELHDRLAAQTPSIGKHAWPNPHEPPPRPAPYRR